MASDKFPEAAVRKALADWWATEAAEAAALASNTPASKPGTPSILTPIVEIDSHRVVRALLTLDEVLGFDVPTKVIQKGGYESYDEMVDDLVMKLGEIFTAKKEKENVEAS